MALRAAPTGKLGRSLERSSRHAHAESDGRRDALDPPSLTDAADATRGLSLRGSMERSSGFRRRVRKFDSCQGIPSSRRLPKKYPRIGPFLCPDQGAAARIRSYEFGVAATIVGTPISGRLVVGAMLDSMSRSFLILPLLLLALVRRDPAGARTFMGS